MHDTPLLTFWSFELDRNLHTLVPRSHEHNPLDFCVQSYLKSLVYTTSNKNLKYLVALVVELSIRRRLKACIIARGAHC